jgi:hypothetical protein
MAIREAPKAVEQNSRREKHDGRASTAFLSSISGSLINKIEKQNGRRIRTANRQRGWTPLSLNRIPRLPPGRL